MVERAKTIVDRDEIRVIEVAFLHALSLRASRNAPADALAQLLSPASLPAPAAPCTFTGDAHRLCAWLEPQAWLVLADAATALQSTDEILVTDVSARTCAFDISGKRARDLIAAGCDPQIVGPGRAVRTRFAELATAVIVQLGPQSWRILVDVSIGATIGEWLAMSAG